MEQQTGNRELRAQVCIVGAGYAGLAAAKALIGKKTVIVLEARERVGGRVWTELDPLPPLLLILLRSISLRRDSEASRTRWVWV